MSIYKQLFQEAFEVVKKHRLLWFFGFFAILFSGSVEGDMYYNFLSNQKNSIYDLAQVAGTGIFNKDVLTNLQAAVSTNINSTSVIFFVLLCMILALVLLLLLSVGSQIVVIGRAAEVIKSPKATALKLSALMAGAAQNIKHSLFKASLVNVLFKLFVFFLFMLVTLPVMITASATNVWADLSYLLLFVILTPAAIIASLFIKYVVIGIVIEKLPFKQAFVSGWRIFARHWLVSVETSFLLFLFNIVSVFFTLMIIGGLAIPLWYLAVAAHSIISFQAYVAMIIISYVVLFLVFLLCNAIVSTFNISVWTSLYLKLNKNIANNKVSGFINGIIR